MRTWRGSPPLACRTVAARNGDKREGSVSAGLGEGGKGRATTRPTTHRLDRLGAVRQLVLCVEGGAHKEGVDGVGDEGVADAGRVERDGVAQERERRRGGARGGRQLRGGEEEGEEAGEEAEAARRDEEGEAQEGRCACRAQTQAVAVGSVS